MGKTYDVIISGGGPVGMGLAIDLGQQGVRVAVVERYAQPQPVPKGQNLTQRTAEHFHFWGCEAELRAARTIPKEVGIGGVTCYGTLLSPYHYDWLNRAKVNAYYFKPNERLPQYETEKVLRARVAELESVDVLYGWAVQGAEQDDAGVRVTIRARQGEETRVLEGRYAVGCDGSKSVLRESAGLTQTRSDHDRLMVLLVFRSTELHALLERYPGKAFFNVLNLELKGYWQFFGRVDHGSTWFFHAPVPAGTTETSMDFPALLRQVVGQDFALELDYVGFWELRFALADSYRAGRIFVAGDAAHSHPPYGGYGINTGFEDARNLGWKLLAELRGWAGAGLLDSYDAERRPVFASTAKDFIEAFIHDDARFLARHSPERDKAGFEHAWFNRNDAALEVAAFEPNYEGSPIVAGPRGTGPSARGDHSFEARAGHHLAPAVLADGRNVFEALGPGYTLLALGADPGSCEAFRSAAASLRLPLTVVEDPPGKAGETLQAELVLLRPDHFVAWAGSGAVPSGQALALLRQASGA